MNNIIQAILLEPNRLYSPHSVFMRQSGHCFEVSTALCSLLIGFGYDAYVVSGYAIQDVCQNIMARIDSPYPPEEEKKAEQGETALAAKYILKPPNDLRSKFILAMEQRAIDKATHEEEILAEEERKRIEELEMPPPDDLFGLRIHSWVLVLAGSKDIDTSFFIEGSSGNSYPLNCKYYCGIESVWNHINYWVNLQGCPETLDMLEYDFVDTEKWEHLLLAEPVKWREAKISAEMEEEEIQLITLMDEKHLDMPSPWSLRISIPHEALKQRYPAGVKKSWFKRTIVEEYAPYVQQDGLVARITRYNDMDCNEMYIVEERYTNRADKLIKVIYDFRISTVTEYFTNGREDAVIAHSYRLNEFLTPETPRTIEFCAHARHDGLAKLELDRRYMIEHYEDPETPMYYRQTKYARTKGQSGKSEVSRRSVEKIVEKYNRDLKKPASKDVAVREFAIEDREIRLKYHYEEGTVTASTRDFLKPPLAEMGDQLKFNPSLTIGYQAKVGEKAPRQLQLFFMLERQLEDEEAILYHVREMEDLVGEFLRLRCSENVFPHLKISLFDVEHNYAFKEGMKLKEKQEQEYREREVEDEIDYLAPYIARVGSPKLLDHSQAKQVYDWCLSDFKQMLIERANLVQQEFEKLSSHFHERQLWYTNVQDTLTQEAENAYFEEVNRSVFILHSLELRLTRHRDLSPVRYRTLQNYLEMDPRLAIMF